MPRAFSWLQRYLEILDVSPEQLHTRVCKPLASRLPDVMKFNCSTCDMKSTVGIVIASRKVMVTACSGSGAPSVVLEMLVGGHNIVELAASDRSESFSHRVW